MLYEYNPIPNEFSLERLRLEFEATGPRRFAEGKTGNLFRGALGWAMREAAPEAYARYFEPRALEGTGPSGFANEPRPYVLRTHHLDGRSVETGELFHVDLHLFRNTPAEAFTEAFERVPWGKLHEVKREPIRVPLDNAGAGRSGVTIQFVTPTELKSFGEISPIPEFSVVFARARDRVWMMSERDLDLDLMGMRARAAAVEIVSQRLTHHRHARTSSKTGQTHPLGGFTGEVAYRGEVDEFLGLLEAAAWTGIGRQTVWGKGAIALS